MEAVEWMTIRHVNCCKKKKKKEGLTDTWAHTIGSSSSETKVSHVG